MPQEASSELVETLGLQHMIRIKAARTAPLVYLVHGRAGDFNVMWLFERCLPQECNIISLQAPHPDELGGFRWWQVGPGPGQHGTFEDALRASQIVTSFLLDSCACYELQPSSSAALGFSQGAGVLSLALQSGYQGLDGLAVLAGFAVRNRDFDSTQDKLALKSLFWAHGKEDAVIPFDRAVEDFEYLTSLGVPGSFIEDNVGHKVGREGMRGLKKWAFDLLI